MKGSKTTPGLLNRPGAVRLLAVGIALVTATDIMIAHLPPRARRRLTDGCRCV
jgi:hypothetical protein